MNGIRSITFNKYLPIAILYVFFNGFLLPLGLLYTSILTPFLLWWLAKFPSFRKIWIFFALLLPFAVIHFIQGVNVWHYIRSTVLLFTVFIFCLAFYQFLQVCKSIRSIYKNILLLNAALFAVAVVCLFIPAARDAFWSSAAVTSGISGVKRLKMLTYEPSYYSTLLAPIALYYYLKIVMKRISSPRLILVLITIPLWCSLSFGVIGGLALALFLTFLTDISFFFPGKKLVLYVFAAVIVLTMGITILAILHPENILFVRLHNIFQGQDSSFRGRTYDSFYLGWHLAEEKSVIFGVGLGQVKELGGELFNRYYLYNFPPESIAIPNALGDVLATFGLLGLTIRLLVIIWLFFKTHVYRNYYRLSLFLFIFIYQFTGSFIMNIAEYAIWVLAFSDHSFEEFNRRVVTRVRRIRQPEAGATP
jgi:hypothetical protein